MAIFSNDPNQGIRDAGMEQFIPTPVSSVTYKGNAGVNARRAGSYTNTPRIVSGRKKPAPTDPSQMTPEQKASAMAKSGDSTSGKPSQRFAPYDRIRIGPGSTSTQPTASGNRTLAQQVDGILPPVVAKPNIPSTAVLAGKTPPGVSAILGAATASARETPKFPTAPTFNGPTEAEIQAGRNAAEDRIAGYAGLAKDWTDASPEEREEITRGLTFDQMADFTAAIKDEGTRRYGQDVDAAHAQRDAADAKMRATQEARSQRDREFRQQMIERDAEIARLAGRARAAYRNSEQNTRDRQSESDKRFNEAMAESPLSKVFSRKNPFGAGVSELGRFFSSRPGMQDILPYTTE